MGSSEGIHNILGVFACAVGFLLEVTGAGDALEGMAVRHGLVFVEGGDDFDDFAVAAFLVGGDEDSYRSGSWAFVSFWS